MERREALVLLAGGLEGALMACKGNRGPTAPSTGNAAVRSVWSPYLGIHAFAWQSGINQPHLAPLMDIAPVHGLRFGVEATTQVQAVTTWARGHGAQDFLGIFPNEYLRDPGVINIFDATVRACPDVRYWEIGNEVDHFIAMRASEYMPVFLALYEYAHQKHPQLVLIANAPADTNDGTSDFGEMVKMPGGLGALARDPDPARRLQVVAIHIYNTNAESIREVQGVIALLPATTEIWVTETGFPSLIGVGQTQYMLESYPRLRNLLRASRIYWYVFAECPGHALVRGLPGNCPEPIRYSDLYQDLTGRDTP